MQTGTPSLAREYQPAIVDRAAMPTRIEKWLIDGKIRYRLTGIQWGGLGPSQGIEIRFAPSQKFVPGGKHSTVPRRELAFLELRVESAKNRKVHHLSSPECGEHQCEKAQFRRLRSLRGHGGDRK